MQELYHWHLQEMILQAVGAFSIGYGLSYALMGPVIKSGTHGKFLRFPFAVIFA